MSIASAASRAWASVSATMKATASPTWRTVSVGSTGTGSGFTGSPEIVLISPLHGRSPRWATSSPVRMSLTPFIRRAVSLSRILKVAWAYCERRTKACRAPSTAVSSV